MLYNLQNIQLGSPDDVLADYHTEQFLLMVARHICSYDMAHMGNMRIHIPGKILGKQQHGSSLFRMYRQTVYAVLQKAEKIVYCSLPETRMTKS